ncbi:MAG: hypothetical protein DRO67_04915 [Candidatus Asgardarchaeum californiense]|nr:MAG: hypothetical protein DRO67_04915 [Candidatus Asgardarchaeum californiense]
MAKIFLCRFETRIGETELNYYHLDNGKNREEVMEKNEVEHDCGLDTEESPIGGADGQYYTELYDVVQITPTQKKFLNSIGIH